MKKKTVAEIVDAEKRLCFTTGKKLYSGLFLNFMVE